MQPETTSWHSIVMLAHQSDQELVGFMEDLVREHKREIAAGETAQYTLYVRKTDAGEHILLVPPEVLHLVERMPSWKSRLRRCEGSPDLTGFRSVSVL